MVESRNQFFSYLNIIFINNFILVSELENTYAQCYALSGFTAPTGFDKSLNNF